MTDGFVGARPLGPDDLQSGMYVTVLNQWSDDDDDEDAYEPPQVVAFGGGGLPVIQPRERKPERPDLRGQPLLVADVSYPYVACLHTPDGNRIVLDMRYTELTRVSEKYVSFLVSPKYYEKNHPRLMQQLGGEPNPEIVASGLTKRGEELLGQIRDAYHVPADNTKEADGGVDIDEIRKIMEGD